MKKKKAKTGILLFMSLVLLTACQKAPEVSGDDEILRAKGPSEDAVEAVVNEEESSETSAGTEDTAAETVSVVLGSGDSRMKIEAEVAAVPDVVNTLTMQAGNSLDEEALKNFLDPQGEVKDITEEVLAAEETERQRVAEIDEKLGQESSMVEMAGVGDDSRLALTDGNRKAVLFGKTGSSYEDALLLEKCYAAANKEEQELDLKDAEAGDPSFSLQDAKALLIRKLSFLGVEDVWLSNAYFCKQDDFFCYQMQFSPVVDGIPIAYSFGQQDITEVHPDGIAWVCEEGVANIGLWNCCMEQVSVEENEKILSFHKVQEVLETYLNDGSLQCVEEVPFSTAELVYYVNLKDGKLELAPVWNIHMDLGEYVEYAGETGRSDFIWNIYVDAVTGELVMTQ